jgi:hypothetical protein
MSSAELSRILAGLRANRKEPNYFLFADQPSIERVIENW